VALQAAKAAKAEKAEREATVEAEAEATAAEARRVAIQQLNEERARRIHDAEEVVEGVAEQHPGEAADRWSSLASAESARLAAADAAVAETVAEWKGEKQRASELVREDVLARGRQEMLDRNLEAAEEEMEEDEDEEMEDNDEEEEEEEEEEEATLRFGDLAAQDQDEEDIEEMEEDGEEEDGEEEEEEMDPELIMEPQEVQKIRKARARRDSEDGGSTVGLGWDPESGERRQREAVETPLAAEIAQRLDWD